MQNFVPQHEAPAVCTAMRCIVMLLQGDCQFTKESVVEQLAGMRSLKKSGRPREERQRIAAEGCDALLVQDILATRRGTLLRGPNWDRAMGKVPVSV